MVNRIISKGKKLFTKPQGSILSAATIIMLMVVASRVLGLLRQRTLAHFFTADELSLFFAAFRLPDLVFEVLVFGTFSSAFIPVFIRALKRGRKEAWEIASSVTNIGFTVFILLAAVLIFFSNELYGLIAPGYSIEHREQIVGMARILFGAQGFFVVSYVLTAVLESSRRFLIPAIAPLFYNLGIIFGIIFLAPSLGLMAPTLGVIIGAALHLLIQLPLALKLGFRFRPIIKINKSVKKIGRLALPRLIEVSFLQISKSIELFLASLISTASYTYFTFGNTLQLLPVGLFGASIAKAALPTLSRQSDDLTEFKKTLFSTLYQITFLVTPLAVALIVLRIPTVRLVFGTDIFSWEATVQTGLVVSAFALSIVFQSMVAILSRAFYALHDTKTPVIISLVGIILNIGAAFFFIKYLRLPVWGLAAAFSINSAVQAISLFVFINKKIGDGRKLEAVLPFIKTLLASLGSGFVMYFILKFFDRSVWIKKLSFLGRIDGVSGIPFEKFVLDTRYTGNLLILTVFVLLLGAITYILLSILLGSKEIWEFFYLIKRVFVKHAIGPVPRKETETVVPPPTDTTTS